jgi:hypothetical protein
VPAAAVIPAPIAYFKVAAVETLVVEFGAGWASLPRGGDGGDCGALRGSVQRALFPRMWPLRFSAWWVQRGDYLEKNRVFEAGRKRLNTLAWNNTAGRMVAWCWFVTVGPMCSKAKRSE